jgi:hypothetical protein
MSRYALLLLPSANRVYADAATALAQAELEVFSRAVLDNRISAIGADIIGGVPYVTFAADDLGSQDAAFLANLSACYALFRLRGRALAGRAAST